MRTQLGNISLRQLRALVAVADAGSFAGAARALHVTPSALSELIKLLEQAVGARLIDRTTRALWFTPAGETFLQAARQALRQLVQGLEETREHSQGAAGRVAIAGAPSVLASVVLPCLQALRRDWPALSVTVRDERAQGILRAVAAGEVDFGIGGWHPEAQGLQAHPLLQDRIGLLAPQGAAVLNSRRLTARQLDKLPMVGLTPDTAISELLRASPSLPAHAREPQVQVSNPALLHQAVLEGAGYALVPALTARHPATPGLAFRVLDAPVIERTIHLFRLPGRSPSRAAAIVLQALRERLEALPLGEGLQRAQAPEIRPRAKAASATARAARRR